MRLLLDTHALLWWLSGNAAMPPPVRETIYAADEVYVSATSAWEIATKHRLGKLPEAASIAADMEVGIKAEGFLPLPVSVLHGQKAGALSGPHRDPWDRMLMAQAIIEDLVLVSNERIFDAYGVKRLW